MALRARRDEVGCRVCVHNLQSRPQLNRLAGTVVSIDEGRRRLGVRLDGHTEPISIAHDRLMLEAKPPWDNCRHGGPPPDPSTMLHFTEMYQTAQQLTAPCLEHVKLLEPYVRRGAPPAILFASMGVDAFMERDYKNCRGFAVCAVVIDGVQAEGIDRFFDSVATRLGGGSASSAVATLEARLAKCTRAAGLSELLSAFVHCTLEQAGREWSCLQIAAHRGLGLKQSDIDPVPSPVDDVFEGRAQRQTRSASAAATEAGERLGRTVLAELDGGDALNIRRAADALLQGERSGRTATRERTLEAFEARSVAASTFIAGGGVSRLESKLDRCLVDSAQGGRNLRHDTALGKDALLAFEVVKKLATPPLAAVLMSGRAATLICEFLAAGHDFVLDHRAVSAACGLLGAVQPAELAALGHAVLKPVVRMVGIMMYDLLNEDLLDFSTLDVLLKTATIIAEARRPVKPRQGVAETSRSDPLWFVCGRDQRSSRTLWQRHPCAASRIASPRHSFSSSATTHTSSVPAAPMAATPSARASCMSSRY